MEIIIRGKRCEGKSFLACFIEDLLHQAGYIVTLTEDDGNKQREKHQQGVDIDYKLEQRLVRNIDIRVEKSTNNQLWDGRIIVNRPSKQAEERHRRENPKLYEEVE